MGKACCPKWSKGDSQIAPPSSALNLVLSLPVFWGENHEKVLQIPYKTAQRKQARKGSFLVNEFNLWWAREGIPFRLKFRFLPFICLS